MQIGAHVRDGDPVGAAAAPVVLETDPDSQAKEIAWLREQLDS
jgi:hypothetical protein